MIERSGGLNGRLSEATTARPRLSSVALSVFLCSLPLSARLARLFSFSCSLCSSLSGSESSITSSSGVDVWFLNANCCVGDIMQRQDDKYEGITGLHRRRLEKRVRSTIGPPGHQCEQNIQSQPGRVTNSRENVRGRVIVTRYTTRRHSVMSRVGAANQILDLYHDLPLNSTRRPGIFVLSSHPPSSISCLRSNSSLGYIPSSSYRLVSPLNLI